MFRVQGSGFIVEGLGFGVWCLVFGVWCLVFGVSGLGFGVSVFDFRFSVFKFRVSGFVFRFSVFGFRMSCFVFRFSFFGVDVPIRVAFFAILRLPKLFHHLPTRLPPCPSRPSIPSVSLACFYFVPRNLKGVCPSLLLKVRPQLRRYVTEFQGHGS
ncbi:hypothetical protein T484DRAFT_2395730 [Baffinella frigidus]|nr:hypothetical protein T484DRAFT_2395730 [Cryptophyta sp. CCMP2293]